MKTIYLGDKNTKFEYNDITEIPFSDYNITIGNNILIGDYVTIENNVIIGSYVILKYGAIIGKNSTLKQSTIIGTRSKIGHNVEIFDHVNIGNNVVIDDCCIINNCAVIGDEIMLHIETVIPFSTNLILGNFLYSDSLYKYAVLAFINGKNNPEIHIADEIYTSTILDSIKIELNNDMNDNKAKMRAFNIAKSFLLSL